MQEKYFPEVIEEKWQQRWADNQTFAVQADDQKPKFYCLEMLPYPSGNLHMGHVRNYSIGDALAWYKRLKGFNVLHPIGWDSFGQPAEDAAIKRGVNPREWTETNIAYMRGQLQRLGLSYDWSRETFAHHPDYYKFDQWFFLKMYERGLAYKRMSQVNWCPNENTTLSNEQASGGICWRCGYATTKKDLEQWFLRTTDYADQLLDDMAEIEAGWAEKVLKRQRDWIGRSEGAFVEFAVKSVPPAVAGGFSATDPPATAGGTDKSQSTEKVRVFTTRIDTIYGVNAIVVAAEHPLVENHWNELSADAKIAIEKIRQDKLKAVDREEEIEKEGAATGLWAINPFSGERIPIWTANYVLMEYGTGAVMSVPAHDERDFEFAKKYYLDIRRVIESKVQGPKSKVEEQENSEQRTANSEQISEAFTEYGVLINSGEWTGKTSEDAKREMTEFAEQNDFGEAATTYRLRDWGISRQRFWGAPIPIVYCETCGTVPVPGEQLPVLLPDSAPFTGVGESPLAKVPEFVNTVCPKCDEPARRETDTMDTFVDSSWYYFRYTDPHNPNQPFAPETADYWTPVDQYIGGDDHAVMHLIYTRFWTKAMRDLGLVNFDEPVKRLLTQGMVVGETFFDDSSGKREYFPEGLVRAEHDAKGKLVGARRKETGEPLKFAVERMSKSKGNGVDPDEMIRHFGADAARLYVLFAAPVDNELVWNENGIEGTARFLQKVWRLVFKYHDALTRETPAEMPDIRTSQSDEIRKLRQKTHQTIKKIEDDFERLQLNTPVAALMELTNAINEFLNSGEILECSKEYYKGWHFALNEALRALILMLAPYAPHFAEETWEVLTGSDAGILGGGAAFPEHREDLARKDEAEIPVQINGKLRARLTAAPDADNQTLETLALADDKVRELIEGKQIVKIVVVPNRLVNIVVR